MAGSLNQVSLIGNLGADPEVKTLDSGAKVCNLNIATGYSYKDRSGEKVQHTDWHRVVIWQNGENGLVNVAEKYLNKGSKVFVQGQLKTRKWQDQEGNDRYTTEVNVSGFQAQLVLLDRREGSARSAEAPAPASEAALDDEIPF